jgi:hypothetical protein
MAMSSEDDAFAMSNALLDAAEPERRPDSLGDAG